MLYGGGSIGGVVNVIDNKIPTAVPDEGFEGEAEVRGATGTGERAAAPTTIVFQIGASVGYAARMPTRIRAVLACRG